MNETDTPFMKSIPQYHFYKTKYGEELLIDVVTLNGIRPYIDKHPIHTLSYFDITFVTQGPGELSVGNRSYTAVSGRYYSHFKSENFPVGE